MSLGMSRTVVGVEQLDFFGTARPQSLAVAGAADWNAVCRWPPHGHHLAASSRRQRRLPRLLLLPRVCWTQQQIDCFSIGGLGVADVAVAGAGAAGDRRFADQAVWAQGRRGGRASQPDAGPSRSALFVRSCLGHDFPCVAASRVGQGHRIKISAKQELFEEFRVPCRFFSFLLQTGLGSVLLEQRRNKTT